MFDLETLGRGENAPVVQIGAVKFDNNGKVLDTFLNTIDLEDYVNYNNFQISYPTISWWLNRDQDSIKSVFSNELKKVTLEEAVLSFHEWLIIGNVPPESSESEIVYWSHASFDPPKLRNLFKTFGIPEIFYRNHKDIRTLTHLYTLKFGENPSNDIVRKGVYHNALDDCLYQIELIFKCLNRLAINS